MADRARHAFGMLEDIDEALSANKIDIRSKLKNQNLTITNTKSKVRLLPLLSGKIHLNYFIAETLNFSGEFSEKFLEEKKCVKTIE